MSLLRKLFLFAVFILSTYCWLVLFEFHLDGFKDGFLTYYTRFIPAEEKPGAPTTAAPPPKKPAGAPVISGH